MRIDVTNWALLALLLTGLAPRAAFAQLLPPPAPTPAPGTPAPAPAQPPGTPPGPTELPPEDVQTFRQLEQADQEDSGRGLSFVWLAPEVGYQFAPLDALSNDEFVDGQVKAGSGLAFGGTAGVRWLFYTLGARFRYGMLGEFTMWSLGGDAGLRIPLGGFEPYVIVGGGYASLGDFAVNDALQSAGATEDLTASGFSVRLGGGFDYYVTPVFSAGISVDAESLFLSREAVGSMTNTIYDRSGSAVGLVVSSMAVLALHF